MSVQGAIDVREWPISRRIFFGTNVRPANVGDLGNNAL
jgi:hypothetical protein